MKRIIKLFHHLFIPHSRNKYRAKVLHLDFLGVSLALVIGLSLLSDQFDLFNGDILGYATDITVQKVYDLTNEERKKAGLEPLEYNEKLSNAASLKAEDMFKKGYWNHYGPDGSTPWDFIVKSGYQYEYAGENLAKNFMFSAGVVEAWMGSPTHRENIVRPEYSEVGYAVADGLLNGEETTLVVQMFGTPVISNTNTVFADERELSIEAESSDVIGEKNDKGFSGDTVVAKTSESVQSGAGTRSQPSFFRIVYNTKIALLVMIFLIVAVDFYIGIKYHIIRITGKSFIHLVFLAFIIIGVYLLAKGAIL